MISGDVLRGNENGEVDFRVRQRAFGWHKGDNLTGSFRFQRPCGEMAEAAAAIIRQITLVPVS